MATYTFDVKNNISLLGVVECNECKKKKVIIVEPYLDDFIYDSYGNTKIILSFIPEECIFENDIYICDKCKNKIK